MNFKKFANNYKISNISGISNVDSVSSGPRQTAPHDDSFECTYDPYGARHKLLHNQFYCRDRGCDMNYDEYIESIKKGKPDYNWQCPVSVAYCNQNICVCNKYEGYFSDYDNTTCNYDCTRDTSCKSPNGCVNNVCTYVCANDTSCKSPNGCINNVCTYVCANDTSCKSPNVCVNNKCVFRSEVSSTELGFPQTYIYCGLGAMHIGGISTNSLPYTLLQKNDVIKVDGKEFPIYAISFNITMNEIIIISTNTTDWFERDVRSFSRIRENPPAICTYDQSCKDKSCVCPSGYNCGDYGKCCSQDCTNLSCDQRNECGETCGCGEGKYCDGNKRCVNVDNRTKTYYRSMSR